MNQYINYSTTPVQVDMHGTYVGPMQVVFSYETSHIERALKIGALQKVEFSIVADKTEPKTSRKSKKLDDVVGPESATSEANSEPQEEDLSVVATEPTDV